MDEVPGRTSATERPFRAAAAPSSVIPAAAGVFYVQQEPCFVNNGDERAITIIYLRLPGVPGVNPLALSPRRVKLYGPC